MKSGTANIFLTLPLDEDLPIGKKSYRRSLVERRTYSELLKGKRIRSKTNRTRQRRASEAGEETKRNSSETLGRDLS